MNNLIHERVRHNPLIKPAEIVDYVKVGGGIDIKYHHAYHALELLHQHIFGDDVKSYTDLAWWVNAVRETNPGSYIYFDFNDVTQRFNRLFICFGACREGNKFCRPMIFCDCTFLTGTFRGGLMAATYLNGNQGFYPLAYALVSGETNDNWECYCYFHLGKNLPIAKPDKNYKEVTDVFQKETYALSPARYEEPLQEMVNFGRPWFSDYCRNIPREKWSSAFFKGCRYGKTSSSVSESFNNWINREKKLPACALVDKIRLRIMELMSECREESVLMNPELLTPVYQALLELHIQLGRPSKVSQSGANLFEVNSPRILDYVEDYFKATCYRELYPIAIRPVSNYNSYDSIFFSHKPDEYDVEDTVLPSAVIRAPPGRKKGKRTKSTWENSRKSVKCSNCLNKQQNVKCNIPMTLSFFPPSII
ncbi:uncharacterized protein LOC113342262 [Papaver somniferum]|uniref:uncharacterized protein LOC113342262 n=1 Tax=Papaver somniferum TaxID=3469 RepID=UPI000E6F853F|nr:uncharacterized protein LOC113342262 [Papaver somniferum]